ncbi:MAG TPA: outer membrane protein assembly factor BamB [Steroidobacteraceae bacterium]|nr:outer membrane protein assembly factor BamB [Steroidobacteraceae bacterium]
MRRLAIVVALLALAACSKDKEVNPPAELVDFNQTLAVERVWSAGVGGGDPKLRLGLGVTVVEQQVFAAGHGGEVIAVALDTGRTLWQVKTKARLTGGTGADAALVAVGTGGGEVIALSAVDGRQLWRIAVRGEVLSAPLVTPAAVVVRTVDGRLVALARDDGHELWNVEQQIPRLTLRGAAAPQFSGDTVVCGFDNGKVVATSLRDGTVMWETAVAPPRGRTELERLSDIDGSVRIAGEDIYAVGFQGRVAMLALASGQIWWSRDLSSYRGLALDDENVYVSSSEGDVLSMQRRTGAEGWRQSTLAYRGLSAPAAIGAHVAVGDFEGYVHFLDKANGEIVARVKAGGARISTPPVVAGDMLVVIDDDGRMSALRPRT